MGVRAALPMLAAAGLGAAIACGGDSGAIEGTPRPTLTLAPLPATPYPTTLAQISTSGIYGELAQRTVEIIENDSTIQRLIGDNGMTIGGIGGSYAGEPDPETGQQLLVATGTLVTLDRPISHEEIELPSAVRRSEFYGLWPDDLQARYEYFRHDTLTYRLKDVMTFHVDVDVQTARVISFWFPGLGSEQAEVISDGGIQNWDAFDYLNAVSEAQQGASLTRAIVDQNERLASILESAYTVNSFGWELGENRIGVLNAYWDSGVELAGDFPVYVDQDYETGDYRSVIVTLNESFVRELHVHVDLAREEIINIDPDEGD